MEPMSAQQTWSNIFHAMNSLALKIARCQSGKRMAFAVILAAAER
jgi:hypothetical protein